MNTVKTGANQPAGKAELSAKLPCGRKADGAHTGTAGNKLQSRMRYYSVGISLALLTLASLACANPPPLPVPQQSVNLERYAGDWFVHGCIPLRIPFFSDTDARNYTEHYEVLAADSIRMTSAFDTGDSQELERRSFSFEGSIVDPALNTTWKIMFLGPIGAQYSIVYLDDEYSTTIVASANRRYAWIMSRKPYISDMQYLELIAFLSQAGFDATKFRRVPHDWHPMAYHN